MSGNSNPRVELTPGYTPGSNQPTRPGEYSRYNQPAPADPAAAEFGINPFGEPIAEEEEAEAGEAFLEEAEAILDAIRDTAAKVERSEALVKRLERAGIERGAEASLAAERAEGSAQEAEGSATSAEGSATRAEGSAKEALDLVRKTEDLIEEFKKESSDIANEQRAQLTAILTDIDAQMRALEEKTKELAQKKEIDSKIVETLDQGVQTIKNTVKNTNNSKKQSFTRQKMGIGFISFEGHTNILNPFSKNKTNSNIINPILPVNFNVNLEGVGDFSDISAGNYLFVDNFRLRLDDFRNMNRTDFIQLILNPLKYIDFLKSLERSSVERQFIDFRNKQSLSKDDRSIYKENAKVYAAKLFAPGQNFNIVYHNERYTNYRTQRGGRGRDEDSGGYYFDYTIMSHELMKKSIEGPDAFRFDVSKNKITDAMRNTNYTFFNFKVKLILDSREQSEITPGDIKRVGCDQRRARIFKIMGSLEGTKKLVTAIMGPEGAKKYLVDDTKMEQIHGRAKPLPSKVRQFKQVNSVLPMLQLKLEDLNKIGKLPMSRNEDMRRMRLQSQNPLSLSNTTTRFIGGKKTKKHNNKNYIKKQKINKSKKMKKLEKLKKTKKMKKFKKTRKI